MLYWENCDWFDDCIDCIEHGVYDYELGSIEYD